MLLLLLPRKVKFWFIELLKTTHNPIVIPSQFANWRGNLLCRSGFLRLPHQCAHWFAMTTKGKQLDKPEFEEQ